MEEATLRANRYIAIELEIKFRGSQIRIQEWLGSQENK